MEEHVKERFRHYLDLYADAETEEERQAIIEEYVQPCFNEKELRHGTRQ